MRAFFNCVCAHIPGIFCTVNQKSPMAKKGNIALNLSLPSDVAAAAKAFFAPLGKGALSKRVERDLIAFLRTKHALPKRYLVKTTD